MTTYQQKAEQYVREQLPELMELSFGCEVKVHEIDDVVGIIKGEWNNIDERETYYELDGFRISWAKKDLEIIGHPIQLQHWLRVLLYKEFYSVNLGGLLSLWQDEKAWKTGNQAKRVMDFSITTGQPATEADYQAFCNIVGIWSTKIWKKYHG